MNIQERVGNKERTFEVLFIEWPWRLEGGFLQIHGWPTDNI